MQLCLRKAQDSAAIEIVSTGVASNLRDGIVDLFRGELQSGSFPQRKYRAGDVKRHKYAKRIFHMVTVGFQFINHPTLTYPVVPDLFSCHLSSQSTMMLKSISLVALLWATASSLLVKANPINVHYGRDPGYKPDHGYDMQKARAVYFMTNLASNAIVALPVGQDGTVSAGTMTSTGGAGGNLVDPTKGTPNGPDALGSQGSVQVVGDVCQARYSMRETC